jgi:hypothetical protein
VAYDQSYATIAEGEIKNHVNHRYQLAFDPCFMTWTQLITLLIKSFQYACEKSSRTIRHLYFSLVYEFHAHLGFLKKGLHVKACVNLGNTA